MYKLTGNTYSIREQIKSAGGKWNAAEKCWEIADENVYNELKKLIPAQSCKSCGATRESGARFTTAPGYCDDCA